MSTNASARSFAESKPSGSTIAFLACTHFGSIGLSQGLLVGRKKGRIRTPLPSCLTWLLWERTQVRTCLLTCQEALSQISRKAGLALRLQSDATPLQKLGRDGADRATCDETQRHLLADRISGRSLLPKHAIAGEGFRVGIPFFPGLFHQAHRLILILPGMDARKGKPAPPHFVQKTNGPAALLAGPADQAIASVFFSR